MTVKRIVSNIDTTQLGAARMFYGDILDMEIVMNHGWIITFATDSQTTPQVNIATEGGSGTAVPDLSIEVDNFDEVHRRATQAGFPVVYGPVIEPWGVRRFYVRDPFGRLLNIVSHD